MKKRFSTDHGHEFNATERTLLGFLTAAIFIVYLFSLTKRYHGDPIYYAQVVEGLHKNTFFPPDHLLLPTIFWLWHQMSQFFGFGGRAIESAQWLNALAGASAVGALWACLQIVVRDFRISTPLAVLGGLGYGLWWVSVDGHGYAIPVLCLNICLFILLKRVIADDLKVHVRDGIVVAFGFSIAVLIHKMAVFAGLGILLFFILGGGNWKGRWQAATAYMVGSAVIIGGVYIAIGAWEGHRTAGQVLNWLVAGKGTGPFGISFHPGYVLPKFARGFAQMFVWYQDDSSVAGRQFLEGAIPLREALARSAFAPLVLFWVPVSALMIWLLVRLKGVLGEVGHWPLALFSYIFTYFLFFSWWLFPDPWKWCFVLAPFLVLTALSFREFLRWAAVHGSQWGLVATVALWGLTIGCAFNNWELRFHPDSIEKNNRQLTVAKRLAQVMGPKDVLLTPYGNIAGYLEYFGHRRAYNLYYVPGSQMQWLKTGSLEQNLSRYFAAIDDEIQAVQASGGKVYVEQLFDPSINDWLPPWTDYKSALAWQQPRQDIERHLRRYRWVSVFPDVRDLWVLAPVGYAGLEDLYVN
jgi:hypothetical protein